MTTGPDPTGIDLSKVQTDWERSLDALLGAWFAVTADQRDKILDQVRAAINNDDLAALANLNVSSEEQAHILTEAMTELALQAAERVTHEAAAQGVRIDPVATDTHKFLAHARSLANLLTQGMTNSAGREALRRWSPRATGDAVAAAVRRHLESLSTSFVEANLGGALTSAQNAGRLETMLAGPSAAIYGSEVMDKVTCLAPTVLVTTARGEVCAADVRIDDKLLTHAGQWIRPSHIVITDVDEDLVALGLDGERELLVTWDHPVLVVEGGDLAWRQAGQIAVGALVVGQASLQGGRELRVPDLHLGQAPDGVAAFAEFSGLAPVDVRTQRVPVATVRLDDQIGADQEVDDPATDLSLGLKAQAGVFKTEPDSAFDAGLQAAGHVAPLRAVPPLPGQRRDDSELRAAVVAGDQQRRPAADLAAVGTVRCVAVAEHGAAPPAGRVLAAGLQRAGAGTVVIPVGLADGNLEGGPALRAGLGDTVGGCGHSGAHLGVGELARPGAVDRPGLGSARDEAATMLAVSGHDLTAPAFDGGVLFASSAPRADRFGAVQTHLVHDLSVLRVTTVDRRAYRGYVYDLAVPGDETFWAEGVLVHNCKPCRVINGKWIGNSDDPDIVAKVEAVYPNGGYVDCLGGVRCRGTTIAVYRPERVVP